MNSALATYPNPPRLWHVSVILTPRYGYRPVWDRREHRERWIRCAAPALRPEFEHPRAVVGVGGRRHRKRRRAEQRVEVKAWKRSFGREMAAMPKDDLPF